MPFQSFIKNPEEIYLLLGNETKSSRIGFTYIDSLMIDEVESSFHVANDTYSISTKIVVSSRNNQKITCDDVNYLLPEGLYTLRKSKTDLMVHGMFGTYDIYQGIHQKRRNWTVHVQKWKGTYENFHKELTEYAEILDTLAGVLMYRDNENYIHKLRPESHDNPALMQKLHDKLQVMKERQMVLASRN